MGRCIYGGLYDPDNKHGLIERNGFRTDVIECMKELHVPVVRYPGGNFTATYKWLDGVGPRDKRPKRPEPAWLGVESNQFGTDEFMEWCKVVGAEPYLALNMGTGTLEEALGWLEYCNLSTDTHYANMRRENGHEKPYGVKYWALGNEVWGPWQVEQNTKEDYAKKAYQWGKALKLLDPSIKLILCGQNGHSDWDRYVLQECIRYTDLHSIHMYTTHKEHLPNALSPRAAERAIEMTAALIDLARCDFSYDNYPEETISTKALSTNRPKICFDEWNVWDPVRAPGDKGAEECYDVSDMLAVALWLNVFIRQAKWIGMATIAQSVNVIAPLMTTSEGVVKQTIYWSLLLFSKYMRGQSLATHVRSPTYNGHTYPEWLSSTMDLPLLDVSAALGDDDYMNLAVVNASEHSAMETALPPIEGPVQVFVVGGDATHIRDSNIWGSEKVKIQESKWQGGDKFTFQKHSFTLLRWKVTPSRPNLGSSTEASQAAATPSAVNTLHSSAKDVFTK
ncbi:putative glycoside hydrolase family 51 protein [Phaeomoniella chlamydospora]|uniref:non-reducing end alpha-L-arabinofuranosidase n=1 Tax=Phaeomoniella chlamydospora TaxID=158046 RepID=A0A0G2E8X9_PHACM|nr:putative glycoside hydrolase family 51 protein [Phaeomoniella chlamydospora]